MLAALLLANVTFAFQQTAIIPAIPTVGENLHVPTTWTAWLLSGYLIVSSIVTPLLGKLGDQRGKRRLLIESLALFLVGSAGAALSPNIWALISFRALQGFGGVVFPLSFAVARDELPEERLGFAIGLLTGGFGIGTALGLGAGGFIAEWLSWRFIFIIGGVCVLAGIALVAVFIPASPRTGAAKLDLPGGLLFGGSLAALLLALTEGVNLGWDSGPVIALFAGAVVLMGLWIFRELRVESPLIDLRILGMPAVALTNLATLALGYLLFGTFFLLPHLIEAPAHVPDHVVERLHYGFGVGAAASGLYLVPAAVGQLLGGPLSGLVEGRFSPKWPFAFGMVLATTGAAWLAAMHEHPWQVLLGMLVIGLGMGFGIGTSGTLITRSVGERDTGISNAINSALRRVGGGIGGQVGAALLTTLTFAGTSVPRENAFVAAFAVAAVLSLLGALCAVLVPKKGS